MFNQTELPALGTTTLLTKNLKNGQLTDWILDIGHGRSAQAKWKYPPVYRPETAESSTKEEPLPSPSHRRPSTSSDGC